MFAIKFRYSVFERTSHTLLVNGNHMYMFDNISTGIVIIRFLKNYKYVHALKEIKHYLKNTMLKMRLMSASCRKGKSFADKYKVVL